MGIAEQSEIDIIEETWLGGMRNQTIEIARMPGETICQAQREMRCRQIENHELSSRESSVL